MDLNAYVKKTRKVVESDLKKRVPRATTRPATLHKAMRHSLFAGGKRLRPILCVAAAEACGGEVEDALPLAAAVECIHTYSLIHDDLPSMDDDDFRRGVPTCHTVYGEGTAVLAGDALQALAFEFVAGAKATKRYPVAEMVMDLAVTSGSLHLIGGQVMDMEGEGAGLGKRELKFIHESKTAALLKCSLRLGGMSANATPKQLQALSDFGYSLGLGLPSDRRHPRCHADDGETRQERGEGRGGGQGDLPGDLWSGAIAQRGEATDEACFRRARSVRQEGRSAARARGLPA